MLETSLEVDVLRHRRFKNKACSPSSHSTAQSSEVVTLVFSGVAYSSKELGASSNGKNHSRWPWGAKRKGFNWDLNQKPNASH